MVQLELTHLELLEVHDALMVSGSSWAGLAELRQRIRTAIIEVMSGGGAAEFGAWRRSQEAKLASRAADEGPVNPGPTMG